MGSIREGGLYPRLSPLVLMNPQPAESVSPSAPPGGIDVAIQAYLSEQEQRECKELKERVSQLEIKALVETLRVKLDPEIKKAQQLADKYDKKAKWYKAAFFIQAFVLTTLYAIPLRTALISLPGLFVLSFFLEAIVVLLASPWLGESNVSSEKKERQQKLKENLLSKLQNYEKDLSVIKDFEEISIESFDHPFFQDPDNVHTLVKKLYVVRTYIDNRKRVEEIRSEREQILRLLANGETQELKELQKQEQYIQTWLEQNEHVMEEVKNIINKEIII